MRETLLKEETILKAIDAILFDNVGTQGQKNGIVLIITIASDSVGLDLQMPEAALIPNEEIIEITDYQAVNIGLRVSKMWDCAVVVRTTEREICMFFPEQWIFSL